MDLIMAKKSSTQAAPESNQSKKAAKKTATSLPLLLELAYSLPVFILILMDVVVGALSYGAGATWLDIFIRVVVTTVVLGGILWLATYQFSSVFLQPPHGNLPSQNRSQTNLSDETD